ncbi:MAG: O-antigen ligase family protein [Patescibacteria group bacterium]|nr:O-antigen ligase family protein [Patescibacteria group bacterium]
MECFVAYGTFKVVFTKTSQKLIFLKAFVVLSAIQAVIATGQFILQHPLGLNKLGEQLISPTQTGFAKIFISGLAFVRGYGTFPHPNPLSAFLVTGILMAIYLFHQNQGKTERVLYGTAIFLNIIGLTTTFSRAAILAAISGIIVYFAFLLWQKQLIWPAKQALIIVFLSIFASLALFSPFLLARATISDSASLERIFYARVGLKIIENHPIIGIGAGESVLHMQQYSWIQLQPWQIQPVHNYFLLAAAELGIVGAAILCWIFLKHLLALVRRPHSQESFLLASIFISFLILMQFDHYFYTLQQTQLLLWIILGFMAAIKTPQIGEQNFSR